MIKLIAITIAVIAISNIVFGKELQKVSGDCVCYCPKQSGWSQISKNSGWNQRGESLLTSSSSSTKVTKTTTLTKRQLKKVKKAGKKLQIKYRNAKKNGQRIFGKNDFQYIHIFKKLFTCNFLLRRRGNVRPLCRSNCGCH